MLQIIITNVVKAFTSLQIITNIAKEFAVRHLNYGNVVARNVTVNIYGRDGLWRGIYTAVRNVGIRG